MRKLLAVVVLFLTSFQMVDASVVQGAATTPAIGEWGFCTSSQDVGCIESFKTVNDVDQEVVISTESQRQAYTGLSFGIRCSSFSTNQSQCDSRASTPRDPRTVGKCGFTEPAKLNGTASWQGRSGRAFQMTVRTGDFDPVLSMGNGINGTTRTVNDDGTFTFIWSGFMDEIKTASLPSSLTSGMLAPNHEQLMKDFFATAVADSAVQNSIIYVWPAAYLHVAVPGERVNGVWVTECVNLPMVGMWVEANSQMFSHSVGFFGRSTKASSKFSFAASSPHYLAGGVTINPARFNMFIPDSYVSSIGYTADTFSISALKLSAADNQAVNPVLTRRTGGFGLDFGIAHYSSPNPQLEFYNNNWTEPADSTSASLTPLVNTAPLAAVSALKPVVKPTKVLRVGKVVTKAVILNASGLQRPSRSTSLITVVSGAKNCRVLGSGVRGLKVGTCKVKVIVRASGKPSKSAFVSLTVKK
jgi:hypothetical protein